MAEMEGELVQKVEHLAVSVTVTAFNSERWIARALDSALSQKTSFPFEIIVGDDCSTDGTVAIARSYQQRYPEIIRVLERSAKLGMQRNYYETFEACRGKYVAWLDADDYWTDPHKLQLQVELLESDPSVSVCSHIVRHVDQNGVPQRENQRALPAGRYGVKDIVSENFVPSPSIVFRNGLHRSLPGSFFELPGLVDWPMLVVAGLSGDIIVLDRVMANYSITPGSAYMSKGPLYQDQVDLIFCEHMQQFLPANLHGAVRRAKARKYQTIAYVLRQQGDFRGSRNAALKAVMSGGQTGRNVKTLAISLILEAYARLRRYRPQ
jgi:glycosyltransferase involved in cell wall biosynthesis